MSGGFIARGDYWEFIVEESGRVLLNAERTEICCSGTGGRMY